MAFPNTTKRQYSTHPIKITEIKWTPFVGLKTLLIKGLAQNENREYNPLILFKEVDYTIKPNNPKAVVIIANDDKIYNFKKLSLENQDIILRCNCGDFSYRFNFYNHLDHSLYGRKRKKYESKGVGPPANPMELAGICKHLMKLSQALQDAQIID